MNILGEIGKGGIEVNNERNSKAVLNDYPKKIIELEKQINHIFDQMLQSSSFVILDKESLLNLNYCNTEIQKLKNILAITKGFEVIEWPLRKITKAIGIISIIMFFLLLITGHFQDLYDGFKALK